MPPWSPSADPYIVDSEPCPCCLRVTDLQWEQSPFALFLEAWQHPEDHLVHVNAVALILACALTAAYLGAVRASKGDSDVALDTIAHESGVGTKLISLLRCLNRVRHAVSYVFVKLLGVQLYSIITTALANGGEALILSITFWGDALCKRRTPANHVHATRPN